MKAGNKGQCPTKYRNMYDIVIQNNYKQKRALNNMQGYRQKSVDLY